MNYLTTIQSLEDIFKDDGYPYWKLYHGSSVGRKRCGANTENENIDESWQMLQRRIEMYGEGIFTVAAFSSPTSKSDSGIINTIKIGHSGAIAGTQQRGMLNSMTDFIQLSKHLRDMSEEATDSIAGTEDELRQKIELEYKLKEIEKELKEKNTPSTFDKVIEVAIGKLIQHYAPSPIPSVMGTQGMQDKETIAENTMETRSEQKTVDLNHIVTVTQEIQELLPEENVNQLLEKLKNFIAKDLAQAKMLLANL